MRLRGQFTWGARCWRNRGYQRWYRGRGGRQRITRRADGACGTFGASGYMDMLRALLLAEEEQGHAQGIAHVRDALGHQPPGYQSGAFPHHDFAGGGAAAKLCAIGEYFAFNDPSILFSYRFVAVSLCHAE